MLITSHCYSAHFTNSRDYGIDQTWSDFANYGFLKEGFAPLPIISASQSEAAGDRVFDPRVRIKEIVFTI